MNELVIYNINDKNKEKLFSLLCSNLKINTKKISNSQMNSSLYEIIGFKARGNNNSISNRSNNMLNNPLLVIPDFLVFSGFSDEKLDEFLKAYKEKGIEKIPLKAIVTPHNVNWTINELIAELIKENTRFN